MSFVSNRQTVYGVARITFNNSANPTVRWERTRTSIANTGNCSTVYGEVRRAATDYLTSVCGNITNSNYFLHVPPLLIERFLIIFRIDERNRCILKNISAYGMLLIFPFFF